MIKVENLKLNIGFTDSDVKSCIAKNLKISMKDVCSYEFLKLSIDARKKPNVYYVGTVAVTLNKKLEEKFVTKKMIVDHSPKTYVKVTNVETRPVVVGFGPAGMFASLMLARMGLKPIVIDKVSLLMKEKRMLKNFGEMAN